jgi:hypothetical protein
VSLSEQPGFETLTPAQREEIQDWYARRYLTTRDLGRRQVRRVPPYAPGARPAVIARFTPDKPSRLLQTHPNLRRSRYDTPSYRAVIKRPGSGGYR